MKVYRYDIESDPFPELHADLAISTEVAEHLPESCADRFVDLLCQISRQIVLTAAQPSGMGDDHVNEQPRAYWIEKFQHRGYHYLESLTAEWQQLWRHRGVASCFSENLMLFAAQSDLGVQ